MAIGGDLAPALGGRKFSNDLFRKQFHLISNDLFLDSILSEILYITYMTLLFLTKSLNFRQKYSSLTLFLVSSYFSSHPITVLLKILGGRMHGPSATSNFEGTVPPVPPRPPPMSHTPTSKVDARFFFL